jgi:glycine cleavage system transcriptional repressor
VPQLAITVIGADRPGIVAAVTEALAGIGANLEDTSMTILRGHFTMTLVVTAASEAQARGALEPVGARLALVVAVREVTVADQPAPAGGHHVIAVHGADRPGIVAAVSGCVARHGGNITDLTTRLAGDLYVLTMELDLAGDADALAADLRTVASDLAVEARMHAAETDVL